MSLFQAREWWSASAGGDEHFEPGCLCVARVCAYASDPQILTGSVQGVLRAYAPGAAGSQSQSADDLLLEERLSAPILQIETGLFIPGSTHLAIAILHPRMLVVYKLARGECDDGEGECEGEGDADGCETKQSGGGSDASNGTTVAPFHKLVRAYRHRLGVAGEHFTAFNMCVGSLGRSTNMGGSRSTLGRDYICVQSIDGQLQVFEQEHQAFTRALSSCLLPGPLCYAPRTDCVLTATSSLSVECYKYRMLAATAASDSPTASARNQTGSAVDMDGVGSASDSVPGGGAGGAGDVRDGRSRMSHGSVSGRRLLADWVCNVGEPVLDIHAGCMPTDAVVANDDSSGGNDALVAGIIVLGESTLFGLAEHTGQLVLQVRLGYNPSCCHLFAPAGTTDGGGEDSHGDLPEIDRRSPTAGPSAQQHLLIGTHEGSVRVHRGPRLLWSAAMTGGVTPHAMNAPPIALRVACMCGVDGLIASLDARGGVALSYLGTDPPSDSVGGDVGKDPDYEALEAENKRLMRTIRGLEQGVRAEPRQRVLLRAQVPTVCDNRASVLAADAEAEGEIDPHAFGTAEAATQQQQQQQSAAWAAETIARHADGTAVQITCKIFISYSGAGLIDDLRLSFDVPSCVVVRTAFVAAPPVTGGHDTPIVVPVAFRCDAACVPHSLNVRVVATYTSPGTASSPQTTSLDLHLPLCLVCALVPPVQESNFKLTLDTNKPPRMASALFDTLYAQPGVSNDDAARLGLKGTAVVSLRYYSGAFITVLVSKNSGRYRVQSMALDALWLVTDELVRRLRAEFDGTEDAAADALPLTLRYTDPLPLADFFMCIDGHFTARVNLASALAALNDRAQQFRVLQKRLLARFKERNPPALCGLDQVMHTTYSSLMDTADVVQRGQHALHVAARRLSCCTSLLLLLMCLHFGLDDDWADTLKTYLSPLVRDGSSTDPGWEEQTDAAMTHLLRTRLAKSKSARQGVAAPPALRRPADTNKLKKHITIVCDRLARRAGERRVTSEGTSGQEEKKA